MDNIFIDKLNKIDTPRPPVWFMRQAGRILPSYQKLKLKYTFDELMKNSDLASTVSILPIKELGVHKINVSLHPEVNIRLIINVARTEEEAKIQESGKTIQETKADSGKD